MAGSYTLPQVQVFQEFAATPNDVTQNLNACVVGPAYELLRASDANERENCSHDSYPIAAETGVHAANELPWSKNCVFQTTPDLDWFKVTLEDAYAKLNSSAETGTCINDEGSVGKGTKFEFTGSVSLLSTYGVRAGDYLGYLDGAEMKYSKIRSVTIGTARDGEVDAIVRKGGLVDAQLDVSVEETYKGEKSGRVNITVDTDGKMTWTSNLGIQNETATVIPDGTALDIGLGIMVKIGTLPDGATKVADGKYVVTITVSESYIADTVTTVDLMDSTKTQFFFLRHVDSADVSSDQLLAKSTGVTIDAEAEIDISGKMCEVVSATAYLTQRNFRNDHTDGVYSVSSEADIVREFGAVAPENPLAYALRLMLLNSVGAVRYIGVVSDDKDGYDAALKRLSVTNDVYALCPLTQDATVIESFVGHCKIMSSAENKSWRIVFFSAKVDRITDRTPRDDDGNFLRCTLSTGTDGVTTLACSGANFVDTVTAEDKVTVSVNGTDVETTVKSVTSTETITLSSQISGTATDYAFRITHELQSAEYVQEVAKASRHYFNRRAYNVFPCGNIRDTSGNVVSGSYAAAAVCALACSVAPQQPITNVELSGLYDIPEVYSQFSREELNDIAKGGTFIVMQDRSGDRIYVRHQISTARDSGMLNDTELSLVKNLDSISYYFANRFAPYVGRYNITDDLIAELKAVLHDGLSYLETATEGNRLIGPQILPAGTEIRTVEQDPVEKDHAYANVALNLPAPFNNFDLRLQVI